MKVKCTNNTDCEGILTLNLEYEVFGYDAEKYIIRNDKLRLSSFFKNRFIEISKLIPKPKTKLHTRKQLISLLNIERARQNDKFGFPQNNTLAEWGIILGEEFGEVMQEINKAHFDNLDTDNLKTELIQVAAVCFNILEHMEDK